MRARILLTGVVLLAACSRPAADTAADEALDARNEDPDLALTQASDQVPVASQVEVGRPGPADQPSPQRYTVAETHAPPSTPEPLAADPGDEMEAEPLAATVPMPVGRDAGEAVSEAVEEGGGKPTGVSTGLGPVPDRDWADPGIIDNPGPVPGMTGTLGTIGREGVVIIRGGAGGIHDDCKAHAGGGAVAGASPTGGPAVLVNDRDPRRGALINERAPRTSRSPSLPRGGGFVRGGIR